MKYILSFGAGLNSAALLVYIIRNKLPLDSVVFADTKGENDYTYEIIPAYKSYAEKHGIPFFIISRGSLEQYSLEKKIVPSITLKWCTDKFKRRYIRKWLRKYYNPTGQKPWFGMYLGIMYDEFDRMTKSDVAYIENLYPFVYGKFTRRMCSKIIKQAGLPVPRKSGCWYCPWQPRKQWEWLKQHDAEKYRRVLEMEDNCSNQKVKLRISEIKKSTGKMQCSSAGYCGI